MKRRDFFKAGATGLALAAVSASPSLALPAQAKYKRRQSVPFSPLMKGVGCNDTPSFDIQGAALGVSWMYMGYDWAVGGNTYPHGWVIQLDRSTVPSVPDIKVRTANQNYINGGRLVMLGNEQDAPGGKTPQQMAAILNAQVAAWLAVDPLAKFAITLGSQGGAPQGGLNKWGGAVWGLLNYTSAARTIALFSHYYSQNGSGNKPNVYFSEQGMRDFCAGLVSWRNVHAAGVPLWITEYGLYKAGLDLTDDRVKTFPFAQMDAMQQSGIARAAWYGLSDVTISGWVTLTTGNSAALTPTGVGFSQVQ